MSFSPRFAVILVFCFSASLAFSGTAPGLEQPFTLQMAGGARPSEIVFEAGAEKISVTLVPDQTGDAIKVRTGGAKSGTLVFRARERGGKKAMAGEDLGSGWADRPLHGLARAAPGRARVWLEGRLLLDAPLPAGEAKIALVAGQGAKFDHPEPAASAVPEEFEPLELSHLQEKPEAQRTVEVGGIPFNVTGVASLARAGWPEWKLNPGGTKAENYDGGPRYVGQPEMPFVQIPKADYTAAYVLAYVEGRGGRFQPDHFSRRSEKHGRGGGTAR